MVARQCRQLQAPACTLPARVDTTKGMAMEKAAKKAAKKVAAQVSKTQKVLEHLQKRSLTRAEAEKRYGAASLSGIIGTLRRRGHKIRTDMVPSGNRFVARYTLG